jgi:predicted membrane-bound spermidine synthase
VIDCSLVIDAWLIDALVIGTRLIDVLLIDAVLECWVRLELLCSLFVDNRRPATGRRLF